MDERLHTLVASNLVPTVVLAGIGSNNNWRANIQETEQTQERASSFDFIIIIVDLPTMRNLPLDLFIGCLKQKMGKDDFFYVLALLSQIYRYTSLAYVLPVVKG